MGTVEPLDTVRGFRHLSGRYRPGYSQSLAQAIAASAARPQWLCAMDQPATHIPTMA